VFLDYLNQDMELPVCVEKII